MMSESSLPSLRTMVKCRPLHQSRRLSRLLHQSRRQHQRLHRRQHQRLHRRQHRRQHLRQPQNLPPHLLPLPRQIRLQQQRVQRVKTTLGCSLLSCGDWSMSMASTLRQLPAPVRVGASPARTFSTTLTRLGRMLHQRLHRRQPPQRPQLPHRLKPRQLHRRQPLPHRQLQEPVKLLCRCQKFVNSPATIWLPAKQHHRMSSAWWKSTMQMSIAQGQR